MKERKQRHDGYIEQLLESFDVWKESDKHFRSRCPIHDGENIASFRISAWGDWRCYSCGAGGSDLESLLMRWHRLPYGEAKALVGEAPKRFLRLEQIAQLPAWDKRKDGRTGDERTIRERDIALAKNLCPKSLTARGFSPDILQRYEIGYDMPNRRVMIPVRDVDAVLVGVTYREDWHGSLLFRGKPVKYMHESFTKSEHLWGFYMHSDNDVEQLFLTEGQLDAVNLAQLGHAAVAIMGASLSRSQLDLLSRRAKTKRIVLALDNNEAGRVGTKHAVQMLVKTRFGRGLRLAYYPTDDPGDLREHHHISMKPWLKAVI